MLRRYYKYASSQNLRSLYEKARYVARRIAKTPRYKRSRLQRKKVEILLAHLKRLALAD